MDPHFDQLQVEQVLSRDDNNSVITMNVEHLHCSCCIFRRRMCFIWFERNGHSLISYFPVGVTIRIVPTFLRCSKIISNSDRETPRSSKASNSN